MSNNLLSVAGWYFLPNLVTGYLQSFLYTIITRAGDPKPSPRSPRYARDRRLIHIAVILAYLAYTIYEADHTLRASGDFYSALGVGHGVDEKGLQSRFRRITVTLHPDKYTGPAAGKGAVEGHYIYLKTARDTLVEPAKRFAYDRFGPDVLGWRGCKTVRDYVLQGVQQTALYYFASGVGLVLMGLLGYLQQGRFWRFVAMGAMFLIEISVAMSPTFPAGLEVVNGVLVGTGVRQAYLPFQFLALLRKLGITFFIALSQLGPLLNSPTTGVAEGEAGTQQQLDRLDALTRTADQEVSRLMGLELTPFVGERSGLKDLRECVKEWLVQNTVRNDPEVKGAVGRVLERRRREGTPGMAGGGER